MSHFKRQGRAPAFKEFQVSRRTFVKRIAAAAALTGLPGWFLERQALAAEDVAKVPTPNDRPGIALIGCGGMGKGDATNAAKHGEILAVCDVDQNHSAEAAKKFTV
ncbi:MAG TPA: twin-arginine translocation signal domain-containing protein, partial [Opitutaceae bacterium]